VDGSPEELERGLREGYSGDGEALAAAYWDAVEAMILAGGLDILGHVDLIRKNNSVRPFFNPAGAANLRRAGDIAKAAGAANAAGYGITVEVNTGGLNRKKISDTYPSVPLLRLFRENNVPAIITADAHQAEDLDGHYGDALAALSAAGYTETVLLAGRKEGKPYWKYRRIGK
jgi:histidinol-phosphatase (PHP family)